MAKEKTDYIVVRNVARKIGLGWGERLDGKPGNKFEKGEAFKIPKFLERGKDENGKPKKVNALDELKKLYPGEISTDDGVAAKSEVAELNKEIAALKADNERLTALLKKNKIDPETGKSEKDTGAGKDAKDNANGQDQK